MLLLQSVGGELAPGLLHLGALLWGPGVLIIHPDLPAFIAVQAVQQGVPIGVRCGRELPHCGLLASTAIFAIIADADEQQYARFMTRSARVRG